MKAFLDTSVLIAAFYSNHAHHEPSFDLFAQQKKSAGCTAAHCLAEAYAVMTAMAGANRCSPDEALLFLNDARERLGLIVLNEMEHFTVLERCAANGIVGGTSYDAVIAQCALKADAQILYTWNIKHFNRLGGDVAARVRQPPSTP